MTTSICSRGSSGKWRRRTYRNCWRTASVCWATTPADGEGRTGIAGVLPPSAGRRLPLTRKERLRHRRSNHSGRHLALEGPGVELAAPVRRHGIAGAGAIIKWSIPGSRLNCPDQINEKGHLRENEGTTTVTLDTLRRRPY